MEVLLRYLNRGGEDGWGPHRAVERPHLFYTRYLLLLHWGILLSYLAVTEISFCNAS